MTPLTQVEVVELDLRRLGAVLRVLSFTDDPTQVEVDMLGTDEVGALSLVVDLRVVRSAGVVEGGCAFDRESQRSTNGSDMADEPGEEGRVGFGRGKRHVVVDLADSLLRQELGLSDVGAWDVLLLGLRRVRRADAKVTALVLVEDAGEDRRRVKVRQAELGDRARDRHQGAGAHVADEGVVARIRVAGRVGGAAAGSRALVHGFEVDSLALPASSLALRKPFAAQNRLAAWHLFVSAKVGSEGPGEKGTHPLRFGLTTMLP